MKNRLILLLLALLGMGACTEESSEEYGVPHADFEIKGRVCDPDGNPIADILIERDTYVKTRTDADGSYLFDWQGMNGPSCTLRFTDTDGPEHGGTFAQKEVTVVFSESDRTAPREGWYKGAFSKTADVTLEPQQE